MESVVHKMIDVLKRHQSLLPKEDEIDFHELMRKSREDEWNFLMMTKEEQDLVNQECIDRMKEYYKTHKFGNSGTKIP